MRNNCFVFPDFFSRNVGNSIKCEKNIRPPPPQITPTFEIQNQNKGIEDIMGIDSNCPSLLFGETTSDLTSKWRGTFQYFFNVENSIKCEMRKNCFIFFLNPPPPDYFFYLHQIFFLMLEIAWNAKKLEILKQKILKILFFSIFKKFIKNSNNIPSISKTIQHTPMTWCTYLQSLEKIHQCVFELQCEN